MFINRSEINMLVNERAGGMFCQCVIAARGKILHDIEKLEISANEEGLDIAAGLSVDKKEENGEGKTEGAPTEENKAMDVDPLSAEAPAKTEVSTKEPVTGGANVDDPSDTVVGKGAELDFAGGPATEVSGKQQDAVPVNEDEKANGEKLATPILKTKEVELPQPQGLHALVDNTATFGEGPKPIEEEAPQARDAIMEPVGLSV